MSEKQTKLKIADVGINVDELKSKGYKNAGELRKDSDEIFSHLSDADKAAAHTQLAEALGLSAAPATPGKASKESASA